jgi:hypothetical protein
MTRRTDHILHLIDECTQDERTVILKYLRGKTPLHPLETEWNTHAESLLTAIARSSDLTQRGIRGIVAEATFEEIVIPKLESQGWKSVPVEGHRPYDFHLLKGDVGIRVQVKLQRKELGKPKDYPRSARARLAHAPERLYCAEVQRTRSGQSKGESTRPYHFGDFDILAVNLHPSTGDWQRFAYTLERWLLPRKANRKLIEIFQPVPGAPDQYWTDSLPKCIQWLQKGRRRTLYKS